jgi:hypothetical protein
LSAGNEPAGNSRRVENQKTATDASQAATSKTLWM